LAASNCKKRDGDRKRYDTLLRARAPASAAVIGARIQALAEADRIESAGDLRKWRYSEVRLQD
jgi:hypothetical protein